MKTLQTHYNQIQKGEGNKEVFLKESKSQFPTLIHNSANFTEAVNILLKYNKIVESKGEQLPAPTLNDFIATFKENMGGDVHYVYDEGITCGSCDEEDEINPENGLCRDCQPKNEGMTDEEYADAEEAERLEAHPEKEGIKKIQKLIRKEKSKVKEVSPQGFGTGQGRSKTISKGREDNPTLKNKLKSQEPKPQPKYTMKDGVPHKYVDGKLTPLSKINENKKHSCKCGKHTVTEGRKPKAKAKEGLNVNGYDATDKKNIDNLSGQQFREGYWCEYNDPKNFAKTEQQLKDIVAKNLAKNQSYYIENYAFGIKDLGYSTDHPGLTLGKEPKGKYKSSGYGDLDKASKQNLKENKKINYTIKEQKMFDEIDNIIKNS